MPIFKAQNLEVRDEVRLVLYDTYTLQAGVSPKGTFRFFSNVQGKSLELTNLRQNGMLETAVSYKVQGMCLDAQNFYQINRYVLPLVMERSSLRLMVGEKDYWRGIARFAGGRLWQNAAVAIPAAAIAAEHHLIQQYGVAAIQPIAFTERHVIIIPPLQTFYMEMVTGESFTVLEDAAATPGPDTSCPIVFSLKGLYRRPVQ
jgi:hypothetical protein